MKTSKKSGTRERILEVANRLFYEDGVRATGTEKIMSISEVAKATFYRHFESKEALVLAYLDLRDRLFWEYFLSPAPPEDIHEALVRMERLANQPEITGCPFLLIAAEFPAIAHPFHGRAIQHKDKLREFLAALLKPYPVNKERAAAKIMGVIDGAFSARMVYGASTEILLLSSAEAVLKGSPHETARDGAPWEQHPQASQY